MEAATELGRLYAEGIGCEASSESALKALHLAAATGSADAYKYLGDMYLIGISVEKDGAKALHYYEHAAALGMHNAYELMADMYYNGEHMERNIAYAAELYDEAAKGGSQTAKEKSEDIKRERKELYRLAIEKRNTASEEAFRCVAISVAMGHLPAYSLLAEYFLLGVGTRVDRQRAYHWYGEAARLGDTEALLPLGMCYSRGVGTALDYKRATEILTKAARGGNCAAEEELHRIKSAKVKKLSKQLFSCAMRLLYQRKFEPAKGILDICAELNNPRAIYTLGCLYEFGMGVATNRDLAFDLYERSYALKFRDPRQVYKLRILRIVK
jgi:TPR repeat protein